MEETVDLEGLSRHNYAIKPEFDTSLGKLNDELDEVKAEIEAVHQQVEETLLAAGVKTLNFETSATFGFCFRLTKKVRLCLRPSLILRFSYLVLNFCP